MEVEPSDILATFLVLVIDPPAPPPSLSCPLSKGMRREKVGLTHTVILLLAERVSQATHSFCEGYPLIYLISGIQGGLLAFQTIS